jgi:hypothetical protein
MQEFIDSFAETPAQSVSFQHDLWPILSDPYSTSHAPNVVQADADRVFPRRYDMSEYLHGLIAQLGLSDPTRDKGLWAWLALLWFDQLAPANEGSRKVGEQARWLPADNSRRYYRHLVMGAYLIYEANRDRPQRAMALLHQPPHTPGDVVGQLAAYQKVVQSKAAVGAATKLYYDINCGAIKRGAGGSGPGSPRRLCTVLEQFDRTFDLQSLTEDRLLALLPAEFDRYKRDA